MERMQLQQTIFSYCTDFKKQISTVYFYRVKDGYFRLKYNKIVPHPNFKYPNLLNYLT